jgi:hypothetical protein
METLKLHPTFTSHLTTSIISHAPYSYQFLHAHLITLCTAYCKSGYAQTSLEYKCKLTFSTSSHYLIQHHLPNIPLPNLVPFPLQFNLILMCINSQLLPLSTASLKQPLLSYNILDILCKSNS